MSKPAIIGWVIAIIPRSIWRSHEDPLQIDKSGSHSMPREGLGNDRSYPGKRGREGKRTDVLDEILVLYE